MVNPPSEKRHAPSDTSSHFHPSPLPRAIKTALLTVSILCLLGLSPAVADDNGTGADHPVAVETGVGKTEIITDEEHSTVRIVIDGKEILTVDKDGLHVNGNIDYTGTIADITGANDAP